MLHNPLHAVGYMLDPEFKDHKHDFVPKLRDEETGRRKTRKAGEESELQQGWHYVLDKWVPDKNEQARLMVEYGMVRGAAQLCAAHRAAQRVQRSAACATRHSVRNPMACRLHMWVGLRVVH